MNFKEACDVINLDDKYSNKFPTDSEILEAYKVFFKVFDVDIQNQDGSYKSIYDIFKEANEILYETDGNIYFK